MVFHTWVEELLAWLRAMFKHDRSQTFRVIEHLKSEDERCEAWLLCDDNCTCGLSGMVAFWLIRHHDSAEHDLLLLCFNTAQVREKYAPQGGDQVIEKQMRRQFEAVVFGNLKIQKDILSTHLFIAGWIDKSSKFIRFTGNSEEYYRQVTCICCHAVDLQGARWIGYNTAAIKIMRAIALQLTKIKVGNEVANPYAWEEAVKMLGDTPALSCAIKGQVTWLTWLDNGAKKMIGKDHILQPIRSKSLFQKSKEEDTDEFC